MQIKRLRNFLIFACVFLWVIMMGSKNVYTAEIVELIGVFNATKTQVSMAMTWYFITYSTVQVVMFFIMDKMNIKWFLSVSMFLSGIVTVLIAFMTNLWSMYWLLALNGILQAGVWGMCIAVLKKYLTKEQMPFANMIMNVGMAVAGIISYGSSALFVSFKRWDLPFILLGIVLSISALLFFVAVHLCHKYIDCNLEEDSIASENHELDLLPLTTKLKKTIFFVVSFLVSLLIHSVFYAGMNWMPNLLTEIHHLPNEMGILLSVLAPVATILGSIFAVRHCEKHKNFIFVALIYMAITFVFALLLVLVYASNLYVSAITLIIFLVVAQGDVTIIFSVLSLKMSKYVNAGAHSGLMNAAGGYAAGFAPTIAGAVIDGCGWFSLYLSIFGICLFLLIAFAGLFFATKKRATLHK